MLSTQSLANVSTDINGIVARSFVPNPAIQLASTLALLCSVNEPLIAALGQSHVCRQEGIIYDTHNTKRYVRKMIVDICSFILTCVCTFINRFYNALIEFIMHESNVERYTCAHPTEL